MPTPCIHYSTGPLAVEVASILIQSEYVFPPGVADELSRTGLVLQVSQSVLPVVALVDGLSNPDPVVAKALGAGEAYVKWLNIGGYIVVGRCELDFYTGAAPKTWVDRFTAAGLQVGTLPILSAAQALGLLRR